MLKSLPHKILFRGNSCIVKCRILLTLQWKKFTHLICWSVVTLFHNVDLVQKAEKTRDTKGKRTVTEVILQTTQWFHICKTCTGVLKESNETKKNKKTTTPQHWYNTRHDCALFPPATLKYHLSCTSPQLWYYMKYKTSLPERLSVWF